MLSSISNLISGQSGVNSAQLVADLVAVTREPREANIQQKQQLNSARISALASASSSLNTFAEALSTILDGRRFAGDLVSSNGGVATASFIEGQTPKGLPVALEVRQLASEQRSVSRHFSSADEAIGNGTLTLTVGGTAQDIVIDGSNNSLAGLRDAVNAADTGITAAIITDKNGARLVLTGQEGADQSFSLSATAELADFADAGMTIASRASDAIIVADGIEGVYSSNKIAGAIEGVRLDLLSARPGEIITISSDTPTATTKDLVTEFIDAFNTLKRGLNNATAPGVDGASGGPLAGDRAIRDMTQRLGRMSSTALSTDGPFRTLADIGVRTARDGTLELDNATFERALAANPEAVAQMLDPIEPDADHPGIAGTLQSVRDALQGTNSPLTLAKTRFERVNKELSELREKLDDDIERYQSNLQQTFANMDKQLAVLRQTQQYIEQQVSIWNNSDNN